MNQKKALLLVVALMHLALPLHAEEKSANEKSSAEKDIALLPATVHELPWRQHIPPTKRQGVPGIERTAKGRLWAIFGRDVESPRNYQVLITSTNDGKSWSDVKLMIMPRKDVRAMSATIWIDPQGRMWVFWGQSYGIQDGRYGIWAIMTEDPDRPKLRDPRWALWNLGDHDRRS